MDPNKIMILALSLTVLFVITIIIVGIIIRINKTKAYDSITQDMNIEQIKEILGKPQYYTREEKYEVYGWYTNWGLYNRKSYTIIAYVNNNNIVKLQKEKSTIPLN